MSRRFSKLLLNLTVNTIQNQQTGLKSKLILKTDLTYSHSNGRKFSSISKFSNQNPRSPTKVKSKSASVSLLFNNNPDNNNIHNGSTAVASTISRSVATSHQIIEMSVGLTKNLSLSDDPQLLSKEEMQAFEAVFAKLVKDLVELPDMRDMPDTNIWLERVLQYNVLHGKKNRGLATALAYRYLADKLTDENIQLSYVLGWCTEILQAFFLVADDIMDGSETRRGNPCWYKLDNLGPSAFNDSILLESSIYELLKKYFSKKDYYVDILELFHDITYKTIYGQSLDTRTGLERCIEKYTMERYSGIVKYKTSYYSFTLPVALGMAMARINNPELKKQATGVTLEMGHLFQVQDDYLDCFGNPKLTGKIGTDIQDCKCSWLCVVALQRATPEQKAIILANYGIDNSDNIERIKHLYRDLEIPKLFDAYEEKTYELISTHIQQMGFGLPKQLFIDMLQKIYRRRS